MQFYFAMRMTMERALTAQLRCLRRAVSCPGPAMSDGEPLDVSTARHHRFERGAGGSLNSASAKPAWNMR